MSSPRDLRTLQAWMQSVITHPDGVQQGVDSADARALVDVAAEGAAEVVDPSATLTSLERLEIYAGAYFQRLIECLRAEYSALLRLLGEEAFDALAFGYLQRYPSRSYTLCELGDRFATYLGELRQQAAEEDDPDGWPLLLVELARYEQAVREVFDGPGMEQQPALSAAALAALDPEAWPAARLVPASCLRVERYGYAVHEYFAATKLAAEPDPPAARECFVALTRRDFVVYHDEITFAQHELLSALIAGLCVGEAIERAAAAFDADAQTLSVALHAWFRDWTARGYFQAVAGGGNCNSAAD